MFSQTELIYSIACTAYVVTSLMFAAVRWFHVCPTTRKQKDYYYPARRVVTLFYLTGIVLVPYILAPQSSEAWLLAKGYLPLANFYFCAVLMLTYFGKMKHWSRWRWPGRVATALTYGSLSVLLAVALWPGYHISEATERILTMMVIAVGLLMTLHCILAMRQVWLWIREFSYDNYSNPDDFPKRYAQRILFVPIIEAVLIVPMIVLDSPAYVAAVYMLLSVFNVAFLISILAPKRENDPLAQILEDSVEDEIEDSTEGEVGNCPPQPAYMPSVEQPKQQKRKPRAIPEQTRQKIIDGIEDALTRRRLFLNPNLSLKDIAEVCGYGQTYVSSVFNAKYGGFYDHINMLRIRYADEYMRSHPDITKEEAICQSGFADRQSYYRIRKHLFPDEVQDEVI
jgi:AraC-like DNA-binding protein